MLKFAGSGGVGSGSRHGVSLKALCDSKPEAPNSNIGFGTESVISEK